MEANGAVDGSELKERRLGKAQASLERRKDRLTAACLDEVFSLDRYGTAMKKIEAELSEMERRLGEIDSIRNRGGREAERLQRVESFCSEIALGLKTIDEDGKRRLMELLVERIDVEPDDKLMVHMVIPSEPAKLVQKNLATQV